MKTDQNSSQRNWLPASLMATGVILFLETSVFEGDGCSALFFLLTPFYFFLHNKKSVYSLSLAVLIVSAFSFFYLTVAGQSPMKLPLIILWVTIGMFCFLRCREIRRKRDLSTIEKRWLAFNANPYDFIVVVDEGGFFQYVNRTAPGIKAEDLIGKKKFYDFLDDQSKKKALACLQEAFQLRRTSQYESYSNVIKAWFVTVVSPVIEDNKVIAASLLSKRVTDKKMAEEALQITTKTLYDLYNTAPCGYHSVDREGVIVEMNDTELNWLGFARSEVIGKMKITEFLSPSSVEKFHKLFPKFIEQGVIKNEEFELITRDGSTLCVLGSSKAMYDENRNFLRSRSVIVDITKLKDVQAKLLEVQNELEKRVKERTEALRLEMQKREEDRKREKLLEAKLSNSEKLASIGLLGAGVAHALNSPLSGVLGLIRSYKKNCEKTSECYQDFSDMQEACEHMAKVIQDLNSFSRQNDDEQESLQLEDVCESTLSFTQSQLKAAGVKIEKTYQKPLPSMRGVKAQLQQVLIHIFNNAKDAMPSGGSLIIETGQLKKGFVSLIISDSGEGIDAKDISHIFDPFFTTKNPNKGMGLGLYMAYGIVKKHGGEFFVESERGKGARCFLHFPVELKG